MISNIDPADVPLNFTVADTVLSVTFGQLDSALRDSIRLAIAQGLAIGAGALLMLVSWLVIVNKKTPMFILHQVALLFLVVRSGLYIGYLLGPLNSLSFEATGLFYDYWDNFHLTIAVNTFYVLLIMSVECVFVYQIHVIFKSAKARSPGIIFSLISAALAIVVVVLYVISITHNLMNAKAQITDGFKQYASWENNLPFIMFAASINYTCILLMAKLVFAVRTRRVLGLKQFDAMHILLIMSTQTCIIPSIMVIWSYTGARSTVYLNLSVIIVVCNLPLSSLWASSSNNSSTPTSCQNSFFSRTSTNESSEKTLSSFYKVHKTGSPISDYERGTLAESISDAAGLHTEVDSIERILREVEEEQVYEH